MRKRKSKRVPCAALAALQRLRKRLERRVVRKQGFSLPSINDLGVVAKEAVPRLPYRKRPSTSLNPSEKAWGPKNWAQGPF